MLRFRIILQKMQMRNVSGTTTGRRTGNLPAAELEDVFMLIGRSSVRELCRPGSQRASELGCLIDGINSGQDMRKVRNKLMRKYKSSFSAVNLGLKAAVRDPLLFEMSMYRMIGPKQYLSFIKALRAVIARKDLSVEAKRDMLYRIISFQHDLYPESSLKDGFMVTDDVHKWFWENLPRSESFNHYYFLIKNDVHLSTCPYLWNFTKRLMQGSEMELQLVTFQIFLHNELHRVTFNNKFSKLYSFNSMIILVNKILSRDDFRFIKIYLAALLHKMDSLKSTQRSSKPSRLVFVHFSRTLLYYLSKTGNAQMFLQTFAIQLEHMRRVGLLDDPKEAFRLLRQPLNFTLKLLRCKGLQEEVFRFISVLQRLCVGENREFNEHVIVELMSSFRSFNDPKMTCQYLLSAFNTQQTAEFFNELGVWGAVYHRSAQVLPKAVLQSETQNNEPSSLKSLRIDDLPSHKVLTELYRVLLFTNAKTMGREEYQHLLLELYKNYTDALLLQKFKSEKHDTGILSVFLQNIRSELKNSKLAYEVLKDFYSHGFASKVRVTSNICPFSVVVYKNSHISQTDISELLQIMQANSIPVCLKFCIAMVLRYLRLNNLAEAKSWYDRILYAGFEVKHILLIKAVRDNGWEFPKSFDVSLLKEIDNPSAELNDDVLFLEESSEFADPEGHTESSETPLLEVVDLVDNVVDKLNQEAS